MVVSTLSDANGALAQHGPRGAFCNACQIPVFQHQVLGKLDGTGALRRPKLRQHLINAHSARSRS